MTFKHKLSRRLALLRGVLAVAAALAASCITPPDERLSGPRDALTRILILPDSLAAQQGQVVEFVAVGLTSGGDTANVAVRWAVTGGTITEVGIRTGRAFGRFKPDRPGKHQVRASNDSLGLGDSAVVTVPVPVASVTVAPASASLTVGQTVQLAATLRDSAGAALTGRGVTWSSSAPAVATVGGSGLVTATGAGSATVAATSEGKSGTAAITVTAPPGTAVPVERTMQQPEGGDGIS
ncbi:MAG: Ig-like domain-containing protein, partial [Gammaproteobacteria bacterium]